MIINRIELINALEKAKQTAKPNKIRPILEGIMLENSGDNLKVISTDLSNTFMTNIKVDTAEQIKVVFNPSLVLEYIKQLDESGVEIIVNKDTNTLIINSAEFVIYDESEYPNIKIETGSGIEVNSQELLKNFKKVEFSAGRDDNLALQCIRMCFESNKLILIASDTFRMAKCEQIVTNEQLIDCSVHSLSLNAIYEILKECEVVKIFKENNNLIFSNNKSILKVRLIELEFPNWKSIFQGFTSSIKVEINTDEFLKSLKRIGIFNKDNLNAKNGASFDFKNNKVEIRGIGEKGKVKEKVDTFKEGDDIKINLNSQFTTDFVKDIETSSVIIELNTVNSPVMLKSNKSDGYQYLIMPLALKDDN